jgi:hypothetical protein
MSPALGLYVPQGKHTYPLLRILVESVLEEESIVPCSNELEARLAHHNITKVT